MNNILVILASYNGEKYIKDQIDSILSQEKISVSVKVFDDLSNDNTLESLKVFKNDNQVEIVNNHISSGSAANNFLNAIKNISEEEILTYDFVAFSDQDDIWFPNKLNAASELLIKEKSSLYCSNLILWDQNSNKELIINKSFPQKKYDFLFEGGSAGCTYVFTSSFCIGLKKALNEFDYSSWQFFSHDWFVYFFARINHYKVSIDSNAYVLYRIHDNNVHGQLNANTLFAIRERLKLIKMGWYFKQIKRFSHHTAPESIENKIYRLYSKNYFSRLYVLVRYNFQLIRSSKKFFQFFIISLLPIRIKK
ncbi:glycosyltransferase [Flavobacterium hibisci]|uniref:glycosyltransferase n=1 Tax=Flavobacterium hibisci TaxID=1914462 RepID=UPI001CBC21BE|nr:glycosyltransferase [Flavobacterium hibisci]MBZ4041969.1 glycosyltransferase [Flavobacterium hibisci]